MIEVSAHLGLPPVPTYAATVLWNYRRIGHDNEPLQKSNIQTLLSFTGSPEEAGFFGTVLSIEECGAPLIPTMLLAIEAVRKQDTDQLIACLQRATLTLADMTSILPRMYRDCSQSFFYHKLRPFLDGTKSLASVGLPEGVFFEEYNGGRYRKYCGPSNAQSSLFVFVDIVLGVEHDGEDCGQESPGQQSAKSAFLKVVDP
jgi:indoleamine 2,3-dioxygenase